MAFEVYSGRSQIFVGPSLFDADQIEAIIDATASGKKLPMPTSTTPYAWKRVGFKDGATVRISRKVDKLRLDGIGIIKVVGGEDDGVDVSFNLADISLYNLLNILQINPDETSTTAHFTRLKSLEGADLTAKGRPILLVHSEYDPTNKSDTPKIGTGADPKAFLLFNACPTEDLTIEYKTPQQQIPVKMACVAVDGTADANKGLYGVRLDLSQMAAEA